MLALGNMYEEIKLSNNIIVTGNSRADLATEKVLEKHVSGASF